MAMSAQARLDKLFANRPKPSKPTSNELHFSERELLDYQQQQQKNATGKLDQNKRDDEPPAKEEQATEPRAVPQPLPANTVSLKHLVTPLQHHQQGHVPGTDPNPPVYLRGGSGNDSGQHEPEPVSSSRESTGRFCVWPLVAKFPYRYMRDPDSKVSRRFFASEKIFQRGWEVYYVYGPESCSFKPLLLVPYEQVELLVAEISQEFSLRVPVPPYPFQLAFYKDGTPLPEHLGSFHSKQEFSDMQVKIPAVSKAYDRLSPGATERQRQDHEAWREKVETALDADKKKKGSSKSKRQQYRHSATIMESANQLQRAQRYLGLRQKPSPVQVIRAGDDSDGVSVEPVRDTHLSFEILDVQKPVPFPFEDQAVVVAFDVESWERDHSLITEIGISTLDTADLRDLPPGEQGTEWIKKIRSRHFRIKGREGLRNTQYVHGDPTMFQFGCSEFVAIADAAEAADSCFDFPYSAGFECKGPLEADAEGLPTSRKPAVLDESKHLDGIPEPRNLLALGHDVDSDVEYLSVLGSAIFGPGLNLSADQSNRRQKAQSSMREILDTAVLYKALKKEDQPKSLVKLCYELDITAWYAHNAGNDARYTLEAFIKLVFKARQQEDTANSAATGQDTLKPKTKIRQGNGEQVADAGIEAESKDITARDSATAVLAEDSNFASVGCSEDTLRAGDSDDEYPY